MNPDIVALLIPIVSTIAVFSFLAVASWTNARRKEREAYYKSETLKKLAEVQGNAAGAILELLREEDRIESQRRIDGRKLGGLISVAAGAGLAVFLRAIDHNEPAYLAALIPLLVGVALLAHAYLLTPGSEKAIR
jgi:uncharacterized membrane protein (GlpM family)